MAKRALSVLRPVKLSRRQLAVVRQAHDQRRAAALQTEVDDLARRVIDAERRERFYGARATELRARTSRVRLILEELLA